MTKDEIIKDLEAQIFTLKALLKLKDEMIELLKEKQKTTISGQLCPSFLNLPQATNLL